MSAEKSNVVNLQDKQLQGKYLQDKCLQDKCLQEKQRESRKQVLERLFNAHRPDLRAFLIGRTGLEQEVDDVIQDVFARLAELDDLQERLPSGDKRNIPYLFSMAHNLVVDRERRKAMSQRRMVLYADDPEAEVNGASPEEITLAGQELQMAKQAIMNLRPNWRRAFILNRFQYKTYRQIAEEMGVSVKQVEKYMKNALARLREATADAAMRSNSHG